MQVWRKKNISPIPVLKIKKTQCHTLPFWTLHSNNSRPSGKWPPCIVPYMWGISVSDQPVWGVRDSLQPRCAKTHGSVQAVALKCRERQRRLCLRMPPNSGSLQIHIYRFSRLYLRKCVNSIWVLENASRTSFQPEMGVSSSHAKQKNKKILLCSVTNVCV